MTSRPATGNAINAIALFFCFNLYFLVVFGSETFSLSIFNDNGAISILTICCLLCAQLFVLYEVATGKGLSRKADGVILAYVLQIYLMREADFHRTFTASNVTKGSYYTDPGNPLLVKLIAGSVLIFCLLGLLYLAIRYARPCIGALMQRVPWSIALLLWFVLLLLSQIFDKSGLNDSPDLRIKNIEEMLEFSASLFAFLAAAQYSLGGIELRRQVVND